MYLVYMPYASAVELAQAAPDDQTTMTQRIVEQAARHQRNQFILQLISTAAAIAIASAALWRVRKEK